MSGACHVSSMRKWWRKRSRASLSALRWGRAAILANTALHARADMKELVSGTV